MSYEKSIQVFIAVIKNQPQLFNAADSDELKKIAADLPTNLEEIWCIISPWLDAHPAIKSAFTTNYVSGKNLGPDRSKSQQNPVESAIDPALAIQLKNEIMNHQPLIFPNLDSANSSNSPQPPA